MENICVIFGGVSPEHDVSIITGVMTLNSLDRERYNPVPVYIDKNGKWLFGEQLFNIDNYKKLNLKKLKQVLLKPNDDYLYSASNKLKKICKLSCIINCTHGGDGESGALSGIVEISKIPYCSPACLASSVCMDKYFTKIFLKGLKIPSVNCVCLTNPLEYEKAVKFGFPLIIKPNSCGSSIGISVVNDISELKSALTLAFSFDKKVIAEKLLTEFTEINCAVYKINEKFFVSECEQPVGEKEVLTFNDKYSGGKRIFPANIDKSLSDKIKRYSKKIYKSLDCNGVIRIDFFIVNDKVFVNEINTVPGSLAYYLFCDKLKSFTKILNNLISDALTRSAKQKSLTTAFNSGIITGLVPKGSKRL